MEFIASDSCFIKDIITNGIFQYVCMYTYVYLYLIAYSHGESSDLQFFQMASISEKAMPYVNGFSVRWMGGKLV